MEHAQHQQQVPNSTLILVLGILSIIGCCFYGFVGIILAIVTLVLAKKATRIYAENPEIYTGYQNVKTGKILAYVGLSLSIIYLIMIVAAFIIFGSLEGIQEWAEEQQRLQSGY